MVDAFYIGQKYETEKMGCCVGKQYSSKMLIKTHNFQPEDIELFQSEKFTELTSCCGGNNKARV